MNKFVCIHGHFYQPPRENAWLESIETQPSAYPYHDWNERVTAQCYLPNSIARINDNKGLVTKIVNNYSRMSFDFGPTLLSWLEEHEPDVYNAIIMADKESQQRFSGHGSAIAQAYNHIVMPLANSRDKYTQIYWGIRDFEYRFKRKPEGMWLPETAVDSETLDMMASLGIKFTILAPRQALGFRKIGKTDWIDVNENILDTTVPYKVNLKDGRYIHVFFYNGAIASDVAFRGLLRSGEDLANRLVHSLKQNIARPQMANIATDGESYGHHHRFGEMALAYAVEYIEKNNLAQITNYGEFLSLYPTELEARIKENSSWSCVHGVERWRRDCGCSNHFHVGWNQKWRLPLRNVLDWLRDEINRECEKEASSHFKDPWEARNDYISVILDRTAESFGQFVNRHASHKLSKKETINALKLMEIQRHAMLMFTSCGWFFDDLARIESVQVVQYAARVVQLAEEICKIPVETRFLERLALAKSNIKEYGNGAHIYNRFIKPTIVDFKRAAAHFAITSCFQKHPVSSKLYSFEVTTQEQRDLLCRKNKIALGRIRISSSVTTESVEAYYMAILRDNYTAVAGVNVSSETERYKKLNEEVNSACASDDLMRVEQVLDTKFHDSIFSIESLFRDARHIIMENVMEASLLEKKGLFYPSLESYSLVTPMADEPTSPLPRTFHEFVQLILNLELRLEFRKDDGSDIDLIKKRLEDTRVWDVVLDGERLGIEFSRAAEKLARSFLEHPGDTTVLDRLIAIVNIANSLPFYPDMQRIQGIYYSILNSLYKEVNAGTKKDGFDAKWIEKFVNLGNLLYIKVP